MKEMFDLKEFVSWRAESVKAACLRVIREDLSGDDRNLFLSAVMSDMDQLVEAVGGARIKVEL